MDELYREVIEWQEATFPGATVHGTRKHFFREVEELKADCGDKLELADVQIMLWGLANIQGIDLEVAVKKKMKFEDKIKIMLEDVLKVKATPRLIQQCARVLRRVPKKKASKAEA